jgi:U3 small nucleolar RNA-associated protein 14
MKEKANKGRKSVVKKAGVRPEKRKDAKLDKVIINQKKIKKNTKYLATQLPFPFETKASFDDQIATLCHTLIVPSVSQEQYERSLRLPKGPEWTTKSAFQDATTPRVLVKQGIIKPMKKPLV